MAPLVARLSASQHFESRVLVTAQHRQMLDQVLDLFEIRPDYDLNLMKANQDLTDITSSILHGCRDIFSTFRPDLVLVHGDTTTSFATSLSCFYSRIHVGHVEAGLRTYNLQSPYPEEFNRQVTTKISRFHFAPTEESRDNLIREGIPLAQISVTGNTVIDALLDVVRRIDEDSALRSRLDAALTLKIPTLHKRRYVLITGHRRENFGEGFVNICKAITQLATRYSDVDFVFPVHLNPNVREPVNSYLRGFNNVFLIEPLDYLHFVYLMKNSHLILTDSGGIQEEAPSLRKPVLVMRDTTERPEAIKSGLVKLVGSSNETIFESVSHLLDDLHQYTKMSSGENPYGDGKAADRIINFLRENL